jgi:hypothetical protein
VAVLLTALLPVAAAAASVLLCAAAGLTQRSLFGTPLEDTFYGFFFRGYPLFLFAIIYGVARIVAAALGEPGPRAGLRVITLPLAVALFLLACLYPTFGGIVLRPAFATGGMSFLNGQSAGVALLLGAGAGAFAFAALLGICTILARASFRLRWRSAGVAALAYLALWAGAVLLQAPQALGTDLLLGFPLRPLSWGQALPLACLVALAALPHALLHAHRLRRNARAAQHLPGGTMGSAPARP